MLLKQEVGNASDVDLLTVILGMSFWNQSCGC